MKPKTIGVINESVFLKYIISKPMIAPTKKALKHLVNKTLFTLFIFNDWNSEIKL